jgi:histidine ammonia-lyase
VMHHQLPVQSSVNEPFVIDGVGLTAETVTRLARDTSSTVSLRSSAAQKMEASRAQLEDKVRRGDTIYGATTGVGGFVNLLLTPQQSAELQGNLIAAVASNVGPELPHDVVRAAMLARINTLCRGHSGIRVAVVQQLVDMFNRNVVPKVPSLGSLGASGDLGPLAYIALVATGRWRAVAKGQEMDGADALASAGLSPLVLSYKEGLSLINGTSMMTGLAAMNVEDSSFLLRQYLLISCLSLEVLRVKRAAFAPELHEMKNHRGQLRVAEQMSRILASSHMAMDAESSVFLPVQAGPDPSLEGGAVEDPYSLRCTPQILGPLFETLGFVAATVENELNSTSDNPVIVPKTGRVVHGGHFHGQYISNGMDCLSIALTTLSNLADRRIDRLLSPHYSEGLPPFLCREKAGIRLGLMGGQFMATSVAAENRSLCHPVSVQTLPSTGGFQDHVSLGLVAARRCRQIFDNAAYVVAFELLCCCQAADIRGSDRLSEQTRQLWLKVREHIPYLDQDVIMSTVIERARSLLLSDREVTCHS